MIISSVSSPRRWSPPRCMPGRGSCPLRFGQEAADPVLFLGRVQAGRAQAFHARAEDEDERSPVARSLSVASLTSVAGSSARLARLTAIRASALWPAEVMSSGGSKTEPVIWAGRRAARAATDKTIKPIHRGPSIGHRALLVGLGPQ